LNYIVRSIEHGSEPKYVKLATKEIFENQKLKFTELFPNLIRSSSKLNCFLVLQPQDLFS